jgi:hypothetical protein
VAVVGTIVLIGITVLIVGGTAQVNGPPNVQRPSAIVMLEPNESGQLLPQGEVGVQLRTDFTGQITIDGRSIPQDQITGDPNLGEVLFNPGAGKDIREFAKGGHTAVVEWWPRTIASAEEARAKRLINSYTWSFNVG